MENTKNKESISTPAAPETKSFTASDMAAAYDHFLPLAEQVPDEAVTSRRGSDVLLARHNVERGVEAVRPHLATVATSLPQISTAELMELPALALGLIHADGRVPRTGSTGEIDAALARVSQPRRLTLTYLEVAAELGLVPTKRVRAVRAGKGKIDNARDCVDIAGIFREYEQALANKHPFTNEMLDEMATTGTWLVETLTPKGARTITDRDPAALIRDRFWVLVEERHDNLRTAGVVLFGIKHVDEYVPPLLSRIPTKPSEPESEPTPEPTPA